LAYRAWGNSARNLFAHTMEPLALKIRMTDATTPDNLDARIESWTTRSASSGRGEGTRRVSRPRGASADAAGASGIDPPAGPGPLGSPAHETGRAGSSRLDDASAIKGGIAAEKAVAVHRESVWLRGEEGKLPFGGPFSRSASLLRQVASVDQTNGT
jgi:hypothetical protein